MATRTPRYLFRCSSDQSNGINTPSLFAPGSHSKTSPFNSSPSSDLAADFISLADPNEPEHTPHSTNLGDQLRQALLWKKDQPTCPFIFFTTSPIFAVQLAAWRSARKTFKDGAVLEPDTGVKITVIDTQTSRTSSGERVRFRPVQQLVTQCGAELSNRSDGGLRTYADHWVVMTTDVVLGHASFYADVQDLVKNGFYELYPAIEAANDRKDPRPSLTTDDLRKYFFRPCSDTGSEGLRIMVREELDTAARVVRCFRPCVGKQDASTGEDEGEEYKSALLAFVLSLRKRDIQDPTFQAWLRDHVDGPVSTSGRETNKTWKRDETSSGIPDADEFAFLSQHLASLAFTIEGLSFGLSIDPTSIEDEKAKWHRWWRSNRDEYRAAHPREQRVHRRDRHMNRPQQMLERRARHDSVISRPPPARRQPRELFPNWRASTAHHYAQHSGYREGPVLPDPGSPRGGNRGYQVLSSRPGDAVTTRHQRRREKVLRRRDQDGAVARRGLSGFGRAGY